MGNITQLSYYYTNRKFGRFSPRPPSTDLLKNSTIQVMLFTCYDVIINDNIISGFCQYLPDIELAKCIPDVCL